MWFFGIIGPLKLQNSLKALAKMQEQRKRFSGLCLAMESEYISQT